MHPRGQELYLYLQNSGDRMELDVPRGTQPSDPLAGYDTRVGIYPQPSSDPLLILQPRRF